MLLEAFREHDLDHWLPKLLASPDVAFEVAGTSEEGLGHPQIVHNGDVVDDRRSTAWPGAARSGRWRTSPTRRCGSTARAPALDEHSPLPTEVPTAPGAGEAPEHPLAGLTIVEFGYFYAMPYGVAMAASLGARVIKLEDGKGDPHRHSFGPDVATVKTTAGKESLSVDLRTPEGQQIAHRLLATADMFVTGFRAGVAGTARTRLGTTARAQPAPGLPARGGLRHRRPVRAPRAVRAGGASRRRQLRPSGRVLVGARAQPRPVGDGDAGDRAAPTRPGRRRRLERCARGVRRDPAGGVPPAPQRDRAVRANLDDRRQRLGVRRRLLYLRGKPPAQLADDEYWGVSALDRCYPAAEDTYVCVAAYQDREFVQLAAMLGADELGADARFATVAARADHDAELESAIAPILLGRTAQEWERLAIESGAGCVAVSMAGHAIVTSFDPGLREGGLTVAFEHPVFGEMVRAAVPVTFSETPGRLGVPCRLGEQSRAVLADLGYTEPEIDELASSGVIAEPAPLPANA